QRPAEAALAAWQQEPVAPQPTTGFLFGQAPATPPPAAAHSFGTSYVPPAGDVARVYDRLTPFASAAPIAGRAEVAAAPVPEAEAHPLGIARGQIARTYIVAEAEDG